MWPNKFFRFNQISSFSLKPADTATDTTESTVERMLFHK